LADEKANNDGGRPKSDPDRVADEVANSGSAAAKVTPYPKGWQQSARAFEPARTAARAFPFLSITGYG